ncbi:MAG: lipo-like protein [Proteobacteria bacterium]|nr:lipo-like protein [Pseudomonadota bacterium]
MIGNAILERIGRRLANYLSRPIRGFRPPTSTNFAALHENLRPGDVLLIDGDTRVATAIKYLTQSTWSHSALHTGPIPHRFEPSGEPHVLVEAEVGVGVISSPLSKYADMHVRICRPVGLSEADCHAVIDFAIARLGLRYDLKNIFDLLRYMLPTPPVPTRLRRRMIALGSGAPTRAICSTLIAQAFQRVKYPILPRVRRDDKNVPRNKLRFARREILHIRHHSLFAPRDFDISPYFAIVKPSIEAGFNYRALRWAPPAEKQIND